MIAPPISPVIHIGLSKTATTTLRTLVFPNHPEICYLGTGSGNATFDEMMKKLCFADGLDYALVEQQHQMHEFLSAFGKLGRVLVASLDNISRPGRDRLVKAHRLKALFPNARIIITLRRPEELILSLYFQALKGFGTKLASAPNPDEWLNREWANEWSGSFLNLQFAKLVELYRSQFGHNAVLVLFYEDLVHRTEKFAQDLSVFLEVDAQALHSLIARADANPRMNAARYSEIRLYTRWPWARPIGKLRSLVPAAVRGRLSAAFIPRASTNLSGAWRTKIRECAEAENASLSHEFEQIKLYDYF
jgi:hypothetical protein